MGKLAKTIAISLQAFTTDDLLAEVVRRRNEARYDWERRPVKWCEDCAHARFWTKTMDPPANFNICSKGHKLSFRMAEEWEGPHGESGFYRRVCEDRA